MKIDTDSRPCFTTRAFDMRNDQEREEFKKFVEQIAIDGGGIGIKDSEGKEIELCFFIASAKLEIGYFVEGDSDILDPDEEAERCIDELIDECRKDT